MQETEKDWSEGRIESEVFLNDFFTLRGYFFIAKEEIIKQPIAKA